jgi:antitoxin VapB
MLTRLFKSGNSLAIRIPRELWPAAPGTKVELLREGDHLVLRPAEGSLAGVIEVFEGFDSSYMAEGREIADEPEREW